MAYSDKRGSRLLEAEVEGADTFVPGIFVLGHEVVSEFLDVFGLAGSLPRALVSF